VYRYQCNWIDPPHPKIFLCVDGPKRWGFFFNSKSRRHGIGQIECQPDDCAEALSKNCCLDISGIKALSLDEEARSTEYNEISARLYDLLLIEFTNGNDLLGEAHRLVALTGIQIA
jgi:hypothetical protein